MSEDLNDVPDVIYVYPSAARYMAHPGMPHESVVAYIDKCIYDRTVAELQAVKTHSASITLPETERAMGEDLNDVPDVVYVRPVSARYMGQLDTSYESSAVPYIDKRIYDRTVAELQAVKEKLNERS